MAEIETSLGTLRRKRGLSAIHLAATVGVSRQTIYAMEAGTKPADRGWWAPFREDTIRKPGTDTKFPAQFAGNWLSVPGFAPRETPHRLADCTQFCYCDSK